MSIILRRALRAIIKNKADTRPDARDPRLHGRTYAIPFEDVWQATMGVVRYTLPGWGVVNADDELGWIVASAEGRILRFPSRIVMRIRLDENGQTRVDIEASTNGIMDFGVNARRIDACLRTLDRLLENAQRASEPRTDGFSSAPDAESA